MIATNELIEKLYQQIEMEMLVRAAKLIGTGKGIEKDNILAWEIQKLTQLGKLKKEELKVLASYSGKTSEEVSDWLASVGIATAEKADEDIKRLGIIPKTIDDTVHRRIEALVEQAKETLNLINASMLSGAEQFYRDAITKTAIEVFTGNTTTQDAIKKTIKEWAESGIPVLRDKAGRNWSAEAYVNMTLKATHNNIQNQMQEKRLDDADVDLVMVSTHYGSRPSHVPFQGKIYSRSGRSAKYPPLSDTGYGTPAGIRGIHCRHQLYAYAEGVTLNRDEKIDKRESNRIYKESQKQRYFERQIRKAKKQLAFLEGAGFADAEIQEAEELLRKREERLASFLEATGRKRRADREEIYTEE